MIVKLYSVRDKLTGFTGPIAFNEDRVAERWFMSFCRGKKEQELTDAKYYDLYHIGSFDTEKGTIEALPESQLILVKEGEQFDEPKA